DVVATVYEQMEAALESGHALDKILDSSRREFLDASILFVDHVYLSILFTTLADHHSEDGVAEVMLDLLTKTSHAGAIVEIVRSITAGLQLPATAKFHACFLTKAQGRQVHYATRANSLKAALYMSQGDQELFRRLKAFLLLTDKDDDPEYL